jgi:uncharacterized protein YhdP
MRVANESGRAPRARARGARLRVALLALGALLTLPAMLLIGYELAAARVPQQRAALEDLIRHETGLEVHFSSLSLRWGWHGPEAVLQAVELEAPASGALLLRAPRLSIGLDLWRMARGAQPQAVRIVVESPTIDLAGGSAVLPARAGALRARELDQGLHLLTFWRGGEIDITGGTLRVPAAGGSVLMLGMRQAQLRHLGAAWNADAELLLPEALGSGAHLTLQWQGAPGLRPPAGGSVRFAGRRLAFGGWHALLQATPVAGYLPRSGSGDLELRAQFVGGRMASLGGTLHGAALEWSARGAASVPLALEHLSAHWQLARRGAGWHGDALVIEPGAAVALAPLTITLDADANLTALQGRLQHAPLPALAAIARWAAPQLPMGQLLLGGEVRELDFAWSARAAPGAQLIGSADLRGLTLASAAGDVRLSGLTGRVTGSETGLAVDLQSDAARLMLAGPQPMALDELAVAARFRLSLTPRGWQLGTDELRVRCAQAGLAAGVTVVAMAPDTPPRINAQLALHDADVAALGRLLSAYSPGMPGVAGLTAGRLESAQLSWRGKLDGRLPWDASGAVFTATAVLRGTRLGAQADWPGAEDIDATIDWRGSRLHALIARARLRPVAGLPPIDALRGSLTFSGAHVQRSTLTGQWLGGPVSLAVAERRDHGQSTFAISGRGVMDARQVMQAASGDADAAQLAGSAEWSALLTLPPQPDRQHGSWQLRADSSLAGVASGLPEPFAKAAGVPLPLHVELTSAATAAQLRVALGERLRAAAALTRTGERWRIERGAVRFAGTAPTLPSEAVLLLDGRVSRLDLAACLTLWRQAARDAALPALRARLAAAQLVAGPRSYPEASIVATATDGSGSLQVEAAGFTATARWDALIDAERPALVHLANLDLTQPADLNIAPALGSALAPAVGLAVDELQWRGRALGSFAARLDANADVLVVSDLRLSGPSGASAASARCDRLTCRVQFSLDSHDAAASLLAFGLRPDVDAAAARIEGELQWLPQAPAPLATLSGHLHMQLQQGSTHPDPEAVQPPFALLSVPALLAGVGREATGPSQLAFASLGANYQLHDGEAVTADLHFDGDAEILMRGRVGLASGDYDEQAWILRDGERLPEAVRRFGATPRVAALWLSLRELFGAAEAERAHAALHLRGSWNDPIVTAAQ